MVAFSRFIYLSSTLKCLVFATKIFILIPERGLLSTLELHKKTDGDAGVEGDVGEGQEAAEV